MAASALSDVLVKVRGGKLEIAPQLIEASTELRLMVAAVHAVGRNGVKTTHVNDIVAEASASKTTFYKYFRSREDCLLRTFDLIAAQLVDRVEASLPEDGPVDRFAAGLNEILNLMIAMPDYTRCLLVEFPALGEAALQRRMRFIETLGQRIVEWDRLARVGNPEYPEISEVRAIGLVASIYELMFWKATRDGVERLGELGPELAEIHAIVYEYLRSNS